MWLLVTVFILLNSIYFFACRFSYLIYQIMYETRPKVKKRDESDQVRTLIVIGSGGHTTEMMLLAEKLDCERYSPRTYVIAETDSMSEVKVEQCERGREVKNGSEAKIVSDKVEKVSKEVENMSSEVKNVSDDVKNVSNEVKNVSDEIKNMPNKLKIEPKEVKNGSDGVKNVSNQVKSDKNYSILKIPRSREVHQSFLTSVVTTLESIFYTLPIMLRINPDLILCNGPGTCIPVCAIAFLMRLFFISNNRIVFIESVCRVKTLSLTGKILLFFADEVLVQWPDLHALYPRAKYIGRL